MIFATTSLFPQKESGRRGAGDGVSPLQKEVLQQPQFLLLTKSY